LGSEIVKINNVLPDDYHGVIVAAVTGELFEWNLIRDISNSGNPSDDITEYAFRHKLWWQNKKVSEWANLFDPLMSAFVDCTNGSLVYVPKVFLNMNMNYGKQNKNLSHCDGSMDMETETLKRFTGIYYVNDSDGDTLFYSDDGETVVNSVSPEANTMIVFRSGFLHSRQLPLASNTRLVLNMNVLVDVS
jgi:hypothetical protein